MSIFFYFWQHRYRNTILDATDDQGQPFLNPPKLFCPFHFMNEDKARGNVAFLEGAIVNQVIVMTVKEIRFGEELFANYGNEVDREQWSESASTKAENGLVKEDKEQMMMMMMIKEDDENIKVNTVLR